MINFDILVHLTYVKKCCEGSEFETFMPINKYWYKHPESWKANTIVTVSVFLFLIFCCFCRFCIFCCSRTCKRRTSPRREVHFGENEYRRYSCESDKQTTPRFDGNQPAINMQRQNSNSFAGGQQVSVADYPKNPYSYSPIHHHVHIHNNNTTIPDADAIQLNKNLLTSDFIVEVQNVDEPPQSVTSAPPEQKKANGWLW